MWCLETQTSSSPVERKTQSQWLLPCYNPLLSPSYMPSASPIVPAHCLVASPGAVVASKGQSRGARRQSHVPMERDRQNLSCVTFRSLFVTTPKRKQAIRKVLFAKINVSYFCLPGALYSNYINYS